MLTNAEYERSLARAQPLRQHAIFGFTLITNDGWPNQRGMTFLFWAHGMLAPAYSRTTLS